MARRVNKAEVEAVLRDLVKLRRTNPKRNGNCIYTSPQGHHCIAGEAMVWLGLGGKVPAWGDEANDNCLEELHLSGVFTPAALSLLETAQEEADYDASIGSRPRWNQLKALKDLLAS